MKICFLCGEHENPFMNDETMEDANNFINIRWIAPNSGDNVPRLSNDTDNVHQECWDEENR